MWNILFLVHVLIDHYQQQKLFNYNSVLFFKTFFDNSNDEWKKNQYTYICLGVPNWYHKTATADVQVFFIFLKAQICCIIWEER